MRCFQHRMPLATGPTNDCPRHRRRRSRQPQLWHRLWRAWRSPSREWHGHVLRPGGDPRRNLLDLSGTLAGKKGTWNVQQRRRHWQHRLDASRIYPCFHHRREMSGVFGRCSSHGAAGRRPLLLKPPGGCLRRGWRRARPPRPRRRPWPALPRELPADSAGRSARRGSPREVDVERTTKVRVPQARRTASRVVAQGLPSVRRTRTRSAVGRRPREGCPA